METTATATGRCIEDLAVGDSAERVFEVAETDIAAFAVVSHDHNPIHLDEAYAAATPFKSRIAHGMLTGGYISAVLGNDLPGAGGVYLSQTLNFKRPVRIGDAVTVQVVVTAIDLKSAQVILSTVAKVRNKTVVDGEAVALVPRRGTA